MVGIFQLLSRLQWLMYFPCQPQMLSVERKDYFKNIFLTRLKQNRHYLSFIHICLKSQRLKIYKKSADNLLRKTSPGNIFVGQGRLSSRKSKEVFGNFFTNKFFSDRVVILMYCRKFINLNMCHVNWKQKQALKGFLQKNFFKFLEWLIDMIFKQNYWKNTW